MSSAAVLAAALALLCAAAALWFVQRGARRAARSSTERFIDSHMSGAARPTAGLAAARGGPAAPAVAGAAGRTAGAAGQPAMSGMAGASGLSGMSGGSGAAAATGAAAAARQPRPAAPHARVAGAPREGSWQARRRAFEAHTAAMLLNVLSRAGLLRARLPLALALVCAALLCVLAAAYGGPAAGGAGLAVSGFALYVLISWRSRERRQRIVRQLPSFLDGIVRLVVLGNSVPAAFQAALQTTEAPLRECLDHVSRMLRGGVEIDRALQSVGQLYRVSEFELVGAVLRLSVKYGGRADTMLDRMAAFMRDLEQAERELVAMSAETRMSAWVLALLPIGIGGFLVVSNPHYFAAMWNDGTGRELAYLAFALQVLGVFLLYRLARLRS
jgi:tight adherence protein B